MAAHLSNLKACVQEFKPDEIGGDIENIAKQWELWMENFQCCLDFEGIKEEEEAVTSRKRAALLAVGGARLREIFRTLTPENTSYDAAVTVLNEYFTPQKNLTAERYKFLCNRPISPEETHLQWATRLRAEVKKCEFDKMDDNEAIKLVITLHTNSDRLQKEIITQNMSLKDTLNTAQMLELAEREIKFIKQQSIAGPSTGDDNAGQEVNQTKTMRNPGKGRSMISGQKCYNCGFEFPHQGACPAKETTCNKCQRKGHYARVCKSSTRSGRRSDNRPVRSVDEEYIFEADTITLDHVQQVNSTENGRKQETNDETVSRIFG